MEEMVYTDYFCLSTPEMKLLTYSYILNPADDGLRQCKEKKKLEGVTQGMVDRCIMDEVRSFLVGTLTSPLPNRYVVPAGQQCELPFYQPNTLTQGHVGGSNLSAFIRNINVGNLVVNAGGNSASIATKRVGSANRSRKRSETKRQKQSK